MKKIGIFTIYIANYGAVLQSYALQRYLRDTFLDLEVYVVDFYTHAPYSIFKRASNNPLKNLIKQGTRLIHYAELKRRNNRERQFIAEEFMLTKRYDSVEELMNNMPDYDIYLTGSDQVFNPNSRYSALFYQKFKTTQGIKAAYAPSFGTSSFPEEYKQSILKSVKDFCFISCREDDGAAMLSDLLGKNIPRVIDPTLLLTKEQWSKIMVKPKSDDKYLLVYDLNGGQKMIDIACKTAREKGLKVWCITQHTEARYRGADMLIFDAGPREFVGLFAHAEYIVTDSFHGTAFSLIFGKEFNTYIAVTRSARRIIALLEVCDKIDRVIGIKGDLAVHYQDDVHHNADNTLDNLKKVSCEFLKQIVTA